jgi:hypothetical protein
LILPDLSLIRIGLSFGITEENNDAIVVVSPPHIVFIVVTATIPQSNFPRSIDEEEQREDII